MKKLLALILCVMMFVAIIPTAAFAESISGGVVPSNSGWNDKQASVQAIKDLKDDMKAMYFAITADQTVFGVAKAYHDLADGLAKNLFDGVESVKATDGEGNTLTIYHDDLVDNVRVFIKQTIGAEIMKELDANKNGWYDADNGTYNPEKYLKAFSDAATKAVNSAKAQKGLESLVWGLAALKAQKAVNDAGETLYYDMVDWGMDKYNEFGFEDFLAGGKLPITSKDSTTWSQYAMGNTGVNVRPEASSALVAMGFAS
jgi:hypothetical protein